MYALSSGSTDAWLSTWLARLADYDAQAQRARTSRAGRTHLAMFDYVRYMILEAHLQPSKHCESGHAAANGVRLAAHGDEPVCSSVTILSAPLPIKEAAFASVVGRSTKRAGKSIFPSSSATRST